MTRDKKPKPPTEAELRILQEARPKHAAEFAAIRLRICGPSTAQDRLLGPSMVNLDDQPPASDP